MTFSPGNGVRTHTCKRCGAYKETAILYEAPTRIAGKGRCETAMVAARLLKTTQNVEKFTFVILANGDNFADALAGSYLAAVRNAPILLYRESAMADTLAFLQNTLSDNGTVYLLGGKSAAAEFVNEQKITRAYIMGGQGAVPDTAVKNIFG